LTLTGVCDVQTLMDLDTRVCSRARLSRDARFDGKFYIAVLTTKVYCRPICPARTCKESNVRYYPTAAAAAEAGFRPCLRCRPECSPGTPAWLGTSNTVSRALRLIDETGLEDGGIESLAERLGIGARHLRRLFVRHLGATPIAVAHTRRLHFAKKLIDETSLPMSQVAEAAGFGCVRRFNAAIHDVYKRTPTEMRRVAHRSSAPAENQYVFRLPFRPPYDWENMLAFLKNRATPGVEEVDAGCYRRSILLNGSAGQFEVKLREGHDELVARVEIGDPRSLYLIIERIRSMFDLNADWAAIARTLRSDSELAQRMKASPGLRVAGCWDGFELTVRAILGQKITVKGASTLAGRIAREFGQPNKGSGSLTHTFPTPQVLADANLTNIGLQTSRAAAIRALSRAVCRREIVFDRIIDTDDFLAGLCNIPGIGPWTAQYVAMRALREPDAFPPGDLGLLRATGAENVRQLDKRSDNWRPWRAYACMYLWCVRNKSTETKKDVAALPMAKANLLAEASREQAAGW
jgi:AraC family transcriptional regulator, regulatory protein of adaptative response / DNA-3-methyladenine glycosylase II